MILSSEEEESAVKSIVILYLERFALGSCLTLMFSSRSRLIFGRDALRSSCAREATKGSGSGVRSMMQSCLSATMIVLAR